MRAQACFFFRQVNTEGGDCYNRPPFIHVVDFGTNMDTGTAQFEAFAVRPPVRNDDFCNFFAHKKKHDE